MAGNETANQTGLEFARQAFANGFAIHGESELLGRSHVAYRASQAVLHDHPGVDALRFVEATGATEGLYAKLYKRRDRLWMKYDIAVKRWSKKLSLKVKPDDLEAEIQRALKTAPTDTLKKRAEVKDVVAAYLSSLLAKHPDLSAEIHKIASEFDAEATAEGQAAGAALMAHSRGEKIPDPQKAAAAALAELKTAKRYNKNDDKHSGVRPNANRDVLTMLAGLAGDVALGAASNGGENNDTGDTAAAVVGAGIGSSFYADYIIHAYWALAVLALIRQANPNGLVNFINVGDDRVCPLCVANEDGNPWKISEVPPIPYHSSCRCWYTPAD